MGFCCRSVARTMLEGSGTVPKNDNADGAQILLCPVRTTVSGSPARRFHTRQRDALRRAALGGSAAGPCNCAVSGATASWAAPRQFVPRCWSDHWGTMPTRARSPRAAMRLAELQWPAPTRASCLLAECFRRDCGSCSLCWCRPRPEAGKDRDLSGTAAHLDSRCPCEERCLANDSEPARATRGHALRQARASESLYGENAEGATLCRVKT